MPPSSQLIGHGEERLEGGEPARQPAEECASVVCLTVILAWTSVVILELTHVPKPAEECSPMA